MLFVLPLIIQRQRGGEMATVEAHVSIGEGETGRVAHVVSNNYRWPNSEVPRTAERLRDVTAVAIASMTYVVEGAISGTPPRNVDQILDGIVRRELIPREWVTSQSGVEARPARRKSCKCTRPRATVPPSGTSPAGMPCLRSGPVGPSC